MQRLFVRVAELPTPCLLLDPAALERNAARMASRLRRHPGVALRQHVKTAKSLEVARRVQHALAAAGVPDAGVTVSTLAEAEAFAPSFAGPLYAVGLVPAKVARLAALGGAGTVDDAEVVPRLAEAVPRGLVLRLFVELDVGQGRAGVDPEGPRLPAIAAAIAREPALALAGVLTHAGHAYDARSAAELGRIAESERAGAVHAASVLRARGHEVPAVSVGSTPTALAAERLDGVTEVRAGVFVLSDLFQAALNDTPVEDVAASVLASVIGVHGERVLLDAGALALSKDRSLDDRGGGYGEVRALDGSALPGRPRIHALNQEHGFVRWSGARPAVGERVRVLPNHACLAAAQHHAYHVVEGERVVAVWPRVVGF